MVSRDLGLTLTLMKVWCTGALHGLSNVQGWPKWCTCFGGDSILGVLMPILLTSNDANYIARNNLCWQSLPLPAHLFPPCCFRTRLKPTIQMASPCHKSPQTGPIRYPLNSKPPIHLLNARYLITCTDQPLLQISSF
jgi:hypothetical protein